MRVFSLHVKSRFEIFDFSANFECRAQLHFQNSDDMLLVNKH